MSNSIKYLITKWNILRSVETFIVDTKFNAGCAGSGLQCINIINSKQKTTIKFSKTYFFYTYIQIKNKTQYRELIIELSKNVFKTFQ